MEIWIDFRFSLREREDYVSYEKNKEVELSGIEL